MRDVVFRGADFSIVRVPGTDDGPVFVTFDSFGDPLPPDRTGFGEAFLSRHGFETYHVLHASNAWYQYPQMRTALEDLRARIGPGRPVITYGSSMGGYAAFRFSGVLQAVRVIAFSPQYSIDPARVPWEHRWRRLAASLPMLWDDLPVHAGAEVFLFYDPTSADRRHAQLISREMKAHHVRLPHSGHPCIALLHELKLLGPTIRAIAAGAFDAADCEAQVRALRTTSACYLSNRALRLPRLARRRRLAMAEAAIALAPDDPWYRVVHGRILAAHGAWAAADARFQEALALLPDHAPLLMEYRRFLMKAGRWDDAEAVLERAIALNPSALSSQGEMSAQRAARAHAARPAVVRAMLGLFRRDGLRGV